MTSLRHQKVIFKKRTLLLWICQVFFNVSFLPGLFQNKYKMPMESRLTLDYKVSFLYRFCYFSQCVNTSGRDFINVLSQCVHTSSREIIKGT